MQIPFIYCRLCGFEPFYDDRGDQAMFQRILLCDYEFMSPWWDEVSVNAKVHCQLPHMPAYCLGSHSEDMYIILTLWTRRQRPRRQRPRRPRPISSHISIFLEKLVALPLVSATLAIMFVWHKNFQLVYNMLLLYRIWSAS